MPPGGGEERRSVGRFPALDPEPAKRSWYRRLALPAAVVASGAAVLGALEWWPSGSATKRAALPTVTAGGQVVVALSGARGGVGLVDPNGGHLTSFPHIRVTANTVLSTSADNRFLVTDHGEVIKVAGGRLVVADGAVSSGSSASMSVAGSSPFANTDRSLLMVTKGPDGCPAGVSVVPLAGGPPVPVGAGDSEAGDPQSVGAFMSVADPADATGSCTPAQAIGAPTIHPDLRVELRDGGKPSTVLATATQLSTAVGQPDTPVNLSLYPDPAGDKVAIVVSSASASPSGIVALDRSGHVLGSVASAQGSLNAEIAWSPDGRSMAYVSFGNSGPQLSAWTVGRPPRTHRLPPQSDFGQCVWSPDGSTVICPSYAQGSAGPGPWVAVDLASGVETDVPPSGFPVAWVVGTKARVAK